MVASVWPPELGIWSFSGCWMLVVGAFLTATFSKSYVPTKSLAAPNRAQVKLATQTSRDDAHIFLCPLHFFQAYQFPRRSPETFQHYPPDNISRPSSARSSATCLHQYPPAAFDTPT